MDPTLVTILVALASALFGTGGGVAFYVRRLELRDKREESEIGRLRADVKEAVRKHSSCEEQLADMEERLKLIEHHHTSYLARWIKDGGKRVTWLNDRAFISIFAPLGSKREDVIGRTFGELLDPLAAAEIDRLDDVALAHPEVAASNVIRLHPMLPVMVVVKVAAVGREGELVYEGYAYRTNDRMISDATGAGRQMRALRASAEHVLPDAVAESGEVRADR